MFLYSGMFSCLFHCVDHGRLLEGGQTYKLEVLFILRLAAHSSDSVGMFRDGIVGGGELGGPCRSQELMRAVQELDGRRLLEL